MTGDELTTIVGENVRQLRRRLGYSQEKLAEHADLHRTYIGTVERHEQKITIGSIAKLAVGLKVEPHVLLIKNAIKIVGSKK